ncbi:MAG: hypothetical protein B7C24_08615 [Bacteroidetes bacterium 4572_77]|nr:MAG: hypothetical protein B7C24_08615 [Bacteroidetes bacterium 4572_77]
MKNTLFTILSITLLLVSSCESNNSAEEENRVTITVDMDENGTTTTIDTIIINRNGDLNDIMIDVKKLITDHKGEINEATIEVIEELNEAKNEIREELLESKGEWLEAIKDLKSELSQIEVDKETQKRINKAIERLEYTDWSRLEDNATKVKTIIMKTHGNIMDELDGVDVEVIIEGEDTIKIIKKTVKK